MSKSPYIPLVITQTDVIESEYWVEKLIFRISIYSKFAINANNLLGKTLTQDIKDFVKESNCQLRFITDKRYWDIRFHDEETALIFKLKFL